MIKQIASTLGQWDNILVLCHCSPDGDTLGSASALVRALHEQNKNAGIECADEIPGKYTYLFDGLKSCEFEPEHIIAVDVADVRLLGELADKYAERIDLAIDHHASHINFAKIDFVDAKCAANTEIIYAILKKMGTKIDKGIANAIYTGISTDTGCFRYNNVTANTHLAAAEMIMCKAEAGDINRRMFESRTKAQVQAEMELMKNMQFSFDDKVAMICVTRELMDRLGLKEEEVDAFVSKPRQIAGVLVGLVLKERENGRVKISIRTNPPANAAAIAKRMDGGGHPNAAGCVLNLGLGQAREEVLKVCGKYIEEISG